MKIEGKSEGKMGKREGKEWERRVESWGKKAERCWKGWRGASFCIISMFSVRINQAGH